MREYQLIYDLVKLCGLINVISDKIKRAIEVFEMLREVAEEA
jgi:hypothetical protein